MDGRDGFKFLRKFFKGCLLQQARYVFFLRFDILFAIVLFIIYVALVESSRSFLAFIEANNSFISF